MAEGFNRVVCMGNIGADPELRHTQGGQPVLNFRMACSESYLDKDKQRKERTEWISVVVWGPRGEALSKILSKGSRLLVEGRLQTTSYDKDGSKVYKTEVVANNVVFAGSKRDSEGGGGAREEAGEGYAPPAGSGGGGGGYSRGNSGGGGGGNNGYPRGGNGGGNGGGQARAPRDPAPPADDFAGGGDSGYGGDDEIPFISTLPNARGL